MGKYTVKQGQSIYDIALYIYGSTEGITDILMSNPEMSLDTNLKSGDVINYTDDYIINQDIKAFMSSLDNHPANGERGIKFEKPVESMFAEIRCDKNRTASSFSASGSGELVVDWGDGSSLDRILLSDKIMSFSHYFKSKNGEKRRVRLYGNVSFNCLSLNSVGVEEMYFTVPINIEEFRLENAVAKLSFAPLMQNTYNIELSGITTSDLTPIVDCKKAMNINLIGANIKTQVIDDYLKCLVKNYSDRRNCAIMMSVSPSGVYREPLRDENLEYIITSGMEAVWVIVNEPSWNEGGRWIFTINNTTYTNE